MTNGAVAESFTLDDEVFPIVNSMIDLAVERLEGLDGSLELVRNSLVRLLTVRQRKYAQLAFPLLVHGAALGDPLPAVPISAIHILWWTSAHFFDDFADGTYSDAAAELPLNSAIIAATLCGQALPIKIIEQLDIDAELRVRLSADVMDGWFAAAEGQLLDFRSNPRAVDCASVLRGYRGKTGGAYAMSAVMSARLAGADDATLDRWREFGFLVGALRQFLNDKEDLASGRDEDIANQILTYLFVKLLNEATESERDRLVSLRAAAATSAEAHQELRQVLLDERLLCAYSEVIDGITSTAHQLLDSIGGHGGYLDELHELVDSSAQAVPPSVSRS